MFEFLLGFLFIFSHSTHVISGRVDMIQWKMCLSICVHINQLVNQEIYRLIEVNFRQLLTHVYKITTMLFCGTIPQYPFETSDEAINGF